MLSPVGANEHNGIEPMANSAPVAGVVSLSRLQFWWALCGAVITIAAVVVHWPISPAGMNLAAFTGWMMVSAGGGFALRVLRRKLFFAGRLSLHKSFSFDALFQAAIFLNPQLRYPDVECEFLAGQTNSSPGAVSPWFAVREAAAAAIPLSLAAVTASLAGWARVSLACAIAAALWILFRAASGVLSRETRGRFLGAVALGIAASIVEGLAFTQACAVAYPAASAWSAFMLYAIMLAAFELSPLPFALGTLELVWLALVSGTGLLLPGLIAVEAYRLFRGLPLLVLMLFYLPRYKMSVSDLFDVRLATVLARTRRRPAAQVDSVAASRPLLSIVIPAYNELERLPRYLPEVLSYAAGIRGGAEVIVVDDGSKDATPEYVNSVASGDPAVRLVRQNPNRGKGAAVQRGVLEAEGRYILFTDADGATPIAECSKLLDAGLAGADIVIGSRKMGGHGVQRERSVLRNLVGSIFYRITNLLAVPGIEDTQCGFKLFSRSAARQIFPELRETGWAFDVEVLFLAQKFGMIIEELPVNWSAVEGSKIRPKDAIRMLFALLRIRHRGAGLTTGPASPR
jgi:dolichyl-phosphate beta-glucosyltransferase